jgi:1-acyl-sn-glycerol-3-phosphate acyltransferase
VSEQLTALTRINLDDLTGAFGWGSHLKRARLARAVFREAATVFARQMLRFDALTAERGLAEAARTTERLYARDVRVRGFTRLPAGPLLVLSNHPGVTDTLALFAALGRDDVKAIALDRPFLLALPNVCRHLEFLTGIAAERVVLVRKIATHLRAGGAVVTFPAGRNEPDPDVYAGAERSLDGWIDSASVFVRLAPETAVVPVCIRGVFSRFLARNPLVRSSRTADEQQLIVSALQLLGSLVFRLRPVTVQVEFGGPLGTSQGLRPNAPSLHSAVITEMRRLISSPSQDEGTSALQ